MSLFDDLKTGELIEKPTGSYQHLKILKEKNESLEEKELREKEKRKELRKKMKEELNERDYENWLAREYYRRNKKSRNKYVDDRYWAKKEEENAMLEEIWQELFSLPDMRSIDEIYAEKYKDDDMNKEGQNKFYWWCSPLLREKPSQMSAIEWPIRVYNRNLKTVMNRQGDMQQKAYEYIMPHINEITIKDFSISKKQMLSKHPMWNARGKMIELMNNATASKNQVCSVASAVLRGKYMQSELYLGRVSFLVGDVIITQAGNVLRPTLENNIPHLNKDTVEELHQKRLSYLKREIQAADIPIYAIWDSYLIKIPINEREDLYYIVPT